MSSGPLYTFTPVELDLKSLSGKERKEQLVQYNLDQNLSFKRWRFTGPAPTTSSDYDQLLNELLASASVYDLANMSPLSTGPVELTKIGLKLSVTSMTFFDKLETSDIVGPGGTIKGCFDETFEGVTVGDKLREMLLNELSDNIDLFSAEEKSEFIFHLFKIFAVGGALCQPDTDINRYLDLTKDVYKELLTLYRDSKTDVVQFSNKVFRIDAAVGLELFPQNPTSALNELIVIVDALKKTVTIVKNDFKPFW